MPQPCSPLLPLTSQWVLLPTWSWSCWSEPFVCHTSLKGFWFLSQAWVDFSTGHLCSLKSYFYSWFVLIFLHACVCMCDFFFNLCFPSFECWNHDGVLFRKPSLANIHVRSLLLLLTHCLHFFPLNVYFACARPVPWEMSFLAKTADGKHGFRWWRGFLTQLALLMWVTCIASNTEASCSWDLKQPFWVIEWVSALQVLGECFNQPMVS